MDVRSEAAMAGCHPILISKTRAAADAFTTRTGSFFVVLEGLRTYERSNELYAIGRDAQGNVIGKTVSNARGGYSNHNFGMAVDVAPDADPEKPGFQPDWDTMHPHWKVLVACMKEQGLAWGGDWHNLKGDLDHFQLAIVPPTPTPADRNAFVRGGIESVWALYTEPAVTSGEVLHG